MTDSPSKDTPPPAPGPRPLTPAQLADLLTNLPPDSTIELRKSSTGEITLQDTTPQTKADLIAADPRLRALRGQPITVTEAAERYGVPRRTISQWKDYGFVAVIQPGYQMTLDESDVAACVEVYKQRKQSGFGFGSAPLFSPDGTVYQIKHEPLARYRRRRRDLQKKAEQSGA